MFFFIFGNVWLTRLLPQDPHIRRAETYGMWWGPRRKHDVVFIPHPPINLPSSTTTPAPPPPLTQPAFTTSPSFPTIRLATPNIFLLRTYSSPILSPQISTKPPLRPPLPWRQPYRSTSRQAAILLLPPRPRLHARTTPALPFPTPASYPAPPRPCTTRTNAASPSPSLPLTSNIPQHTLKQSIPHIPPHLSSTHPPRPHSLTKDARDSPLPVRHMQPPDPAPSHRPHPISSQAIDT